MSEDIPPTTYHFEAEAERRHIEALKSTGSLTITFPKTYFLQGTAGVEIELSLADDGDESDSDFKIDEELE